MLCFLPPLPAPLPPDPRPRRLSPRSAAALVAAALSLALLTPVGWAYNEPQYSARVGSRLQLGPRAEDLALRDTNSALHTTGFTPRFRAAAHASVPPGVAVDSVTGALTGTPSMAGTYTLALAVDDGRAVVSGHSFRILVLPSAR